VEIFHDEYPTHKLVQELSGGGAFERGLPSADELLTQPDVVELFKDLLKNGMIDKRYKDEDEAIRKCHRHGWIQADESPNNLGFICYAFSSPLHSVCISRRLEPTNGMPNFTSLFDLALDVISKFKPSQLKLTIRHGVEPSSMDKPPEAQYQDEFYRSLFSVTSGNVRLSPEFASAKGAHVAGRINFFIPMVKWGGRDHSRRWAVGRT